MQTHTVVFRGKLQTNFYCSSIRKKKQCSARQYWMICKGPGFLTVVWFGSNPAVSKLDQRHTRRLRKRANLRGGDGAKSYNCEKAWSSINHSTLSDDKGTVRAVDERAAGRTAYWCLINIHLGIYYSLPVYCLQSWTLWPKPLHGQQSLSQGNTLPNYCSRS